MNTRLAVFVALLLALAPAARAQQVLPPAAWVSPGVLPPGALPCPFSLPDDIQLTRPDSRPPVVLVHGTLGDMASSWSMISPALVAKGWTVFAFELPNRGTAHLTDSAQVLADFVDCVLDVTGASKVSIVGHSQGGMLPRYYLSALDGDGKVEDVVGLAPSNHGYNGQITTDLGQLGADHGSCYACEEQFVGSTFMNNLTAETPGGADYTVLKAAYDEVLGTANPFLTGATNVTLTDGCQAGTSDHVGILYSPVALEWVINALETDGPADPSFVPASCV